MQYNALHVLGCLIMPYYGTWLYISKLTIKAQVCLVRKCGCTEFIEKLGTTLCFKVKYIDIFVTLMIPISFQRKLDNMASHTPGNVQLNGRSDNGQIKAQCHTEKHISTEQLLRDILYSLMYRGYKIPYIWKVSKLCSFLDNCVPKMVEHAKHNNGGRANDWIYMIKRI